MEPSWRCEPWGPLVPSCLPQCWSPDPEEWTDRQRFAVGLASEILHLKTAGVYGQCRVMVRPCGPPPPPWRPEPGVMGVAQMGVGITPLLISGQPVNVMCGCRGNCSCSRMCEQILDPFCTEMVEVQIDGVVLPATAYDVQDYRRLVRMDGGCWPACQHQDRHEGATGTWTVTYKTGWPVADSYGARLAVTRLAVEADKACGPGSKYCGPLSEWVVEVVRDGVTYQIDPGMGTTGLPMVDRWVATVNPHGAATQFRAWSPDTVRSRRTTWTNGYQ